MPKIALVIAGLDPSGGAGLLLDTRVLAEHEVLASGVATLLSDQDSQGVYSILPSGAELIERQIRRVLGDLQVDVVKVGALGTAAVARAVGRALEATVAPMVLDPLLRSSSGAALLDDPSALDLLLGRATVVTPNLHEAQVLTGVSVEDSPSMMEAAVMLLERGPQAVLLKGGHLPGDPVDLFYDGEHTVESSSKRIAGDPVHGTGCALSSAIAAWLSRGRNPLTACSMAQEYVHGKIAGARQLGRGARYIV